jgi:hypothetical protein
MFENTYPPSGSLGGRSLRQISREDQVKVCVMQSELYYELRELKRAILPGPAWKWARDLLNAAGRNKKVRSVLHATPDSLLSLVKILRRILSQHGPCPPQSVVRDEIRGQLSLPFRQQAKSPVTH